MKCQKETLIERKRLPRDEADSTKKNSAFCVGNAHDGGEEGWEARVSFVLVVSIKQ